MLQYFQKIFTLLNPNWYFQNTNLMKDYPELQWLVSKFMLKNYAEHIIYLGYLIILTKTQKQSHSGVPRKRCLLSNFIEIALRHSCSPINLLHIFISEHLFLKTSLADGCFWKPGYTIQMKYPEMPFKKITRQFFAIFTSKQLR